MKRIAAFFEFERHGTNFRREMVAGATTFATRAYIIVVNPAILSAAGISTRPSTVATIVTCIFGTLLMGLYARRPFAIAPLLGENADRGQEVTKLGGQVLRSVEFECHLNPASHENYLMTQSARRGSLGGVDEEACFLTS
ncbi:MAG: hypothetical protein ACRD6I_08170 [Candidatus Acidiferrales bacterium]